jgi:hypothetical protein
MSGEFTNLVAVATCGAVVAAAEAVTIPLLRRAAIIDVPSHRSSHTIPTPRGGGIPVVAGLLVACGLIGGADAAVFGFAVTRIGRLLRRLSIDEIPQLINVLRGEISIVGPRPTLPYQVQRYDSRQADRLRVLPGLTGLAQVNGRNEMARPERIEWDLEYVASQSLWLDLKVLARTVQVILVGDGMAGQSRNGHIARI